MIIGEGLDSVRQRLDLLERTIAGLPRHELADVPELMLGEVRKLSATLGELLVDAIAQGVIGAPAGRDIDHPWLAIARDRLQGNIVSASCRGYGVLVSPGSCREVLRALGEMQRDYEARLGIEAAHHIDAGSEILHRHVLYEALSWLPRVETPISFPKDIQLEDADGTRIQMIADWVWEDLAVVAHYADQRQESVHLVEQASSPSKLLQQVEERKVVLAEAVRAIRESLLSEAEAPNAEAKPASKVKAKATPKSKQALPGRDATEVVLRYEPEKGYPITVWAKSSKPRQLKEPPRQVQSVLERVLSAAIAAAADQPESNRNRVFSSGFEPGTFRLKLGASRSFLLGWWNECVSDGEALLAGGKKNVYSVNWRMALNSPE